MNYQQIYRDLIIRGKNRILSVYKERHHIIPKCLGGDNSPGNLVDLTPEEHYLAHQLLIRIYPDEPKLVYSAFMMTRGSDKHKRIGNKLYGWLRREYSIVISNSMLGKNHPNYGKPACNRGKAHSQETRDKISESRKGQPAHNKGKPGLSGKNNPMYGVPSPNMGKITSQEIKDKITQSKRALPKLECIHCHKLLDAGNLKRSHGDKCKRKINHGVFTSIRIGC